MPHPAPTPRPAPVRAAVALGSNLDSDLGDRSAHLAMAFASLASLPETSLLARSGAYETAPVGPPGQGPYLNAAAILATRLSARDLLGAMLSIEAARGRNRATEERWGPRTLDLDLIVYADAQIDEPGLTVPHPRLAERAFVLEPLAEIAPDLVVPGRGTVADLLASLRQRAEHPTGARS